MRGNGAHLAGMSRKKIFLIVCCGAIVPLVLLLLPLTGTVKLFNIPSGSMSPTVQAGDTVFATKIFNPAATVKKGDVVVFDGKRAGLKTMPEKYLTRVVATAGDTVDLASGELRVNGVALPERNGLKSRGEVVKDPRFTPPSYPLTVAAGSVFTIGDNYGNSLDGRYLGPLPVTAVTHAAQRIVRPSERAGKIE
jgi:signal peptidase I